MSSLCTVRVGAVTLLIDVYNVFVVSHSALPTSHVCLMDSVLFY